MPSSVKAAWKRSNLADLPTSDPGNGTPWLESGFIRAGSGPVATPTASPVAGLFTAAQSVTLSCATAGASIYYTLDGTTPTAASTLYSSAISVTSTTVIKAIGIKANTIPSAVFSGTYAIEVAFPITTGWDYRLSAASSTYVDNGTTEASTTGQLIYQMDDITNNAANYTALQADSDKRPIYISSVPLTNKPAVYFPYQTQGSVGRRLELPTATIDVQSFSFYAILRLSINPDDFLSLWNLGSTSTLDTTFGTTSEARAYLYPPSSFFSSAVKMFGNTMVLTLTAGSSDSSIYINRSKTSGSALTAGSKVGGLFGYRGDGYPLQGAEVFEFGFRAGRLTDLQVGSIVDYAVSNYGLVEAFDDCLGITGDSIMQGAFATNGTTGPQLIGNGLGNTWKIAGHCQEGRTLAQLTSTDATNMLYVASGISGRKVALNQAGTNDLVIDAASLATMQSRLAAWKSAVDSSGFGETFVTTILPRVSGLAGWTSTTEAVRVAYNSWLRTTPPAGITVIDIAARPTLSNAANLAYFNADGVHLTTAGQSEMVDEITQAILA